MRIVKIVQNFFLIIIRLKRIKKYDRNRIISRAKNKTIRVNHVLRHANSKIKCNKRKNDNESSPPNDHECNKFLFKRNKSSSSNPIVHQLKDNESREDFKSGLLKNLIARNGMRVTVAWRIFNAPSYIVYLLVPWSQLGDGIDHILARNLLCTLQIVSLVVRSILTLCKNNDRFFNV